MGHFPRTFLRPYPKPGSCCELTDVETAENAGIVMFWADLNRKLCLLHGNRYPTEYYCIMMWAEKGQVKEKLHETQPLETRQQHLWFIPLLSSSLLRWGWCAE